MMAWIEIVSLSQFLHLISARAQMGFICMSLRPNSIHHKRKRPNNHNGGFLLQRLILVMVNTQQNKE